MLLFLLQTPPPAPQTVQLSDEQFTQLVTQLQGVAWFLGGMIGIAVMCLAGIAFILATGGR